MFFIWGWALDFFVCLFFAFDFETGSSYSPSWPLHVADEAGLDLPVMHQPLYAFQVLQ